MPLKMPINIILNLLEILLIIVPLLVSVAYFTLAERKILGAIQRRRGPNVVGAYGLLQPLSDGFKLLVKETVIPSNANKLIFILSPMLTFTISLMGWAALPFDKYAVLAQIDNGFIYFLAMSSLGVYGIILSGWSSNSKYAFLGALRSTAQMISYELSIGFVLLTIVICCESFNVQQIIEHQKTIWFIIPFLPLFLIFFTAALAETNRHPFDLPEAEAELVSGYNVEYAAMGFALFSLGEYANMLMMSSIVIVLFLGGWSAPFEILSIIPGAIWFGIKICLFVFLYVYMRGILPRYRYDQLMSLGWKVFLPIVLGYFMFTYSILVSFNGLPF
jgi:NADH-quinone oxidoreductase subunit H